MPLLETIKQMRAQGEDDAAIVQNLQEQGISPREIEDALSQSMIKAAVSSDYEQAGQESVMSNSSNEMQPSIAQQQEQMPPAPIYPEQNYAQNQGYYPQQEYYTPPQPAINPETISEIADQIVSEKIATIKKAIILITEFKTITEAKISGLDSRLKRIESIIDRLQMSIVGKIGEYGKSVSEIKDELSGMEESFSKVINPLMDKSRQAVKQKEQEKHEARHEKRKEREENEENEKHSEPKRKSKDGFENFLR